MNYEHMIAKLVGQQRKWGKQCVKVILILITILLYRI